MSAIFSDIDNNLLRAVSRFGLESTVRQLATLAQRNAHHAEVRTDFETARQWGGAAILLADVSENIEI